MAIRYLRVIPALCVLCSSAVLTKAQDLPNSKDPAGMKRYEGSELIGYRAPMFDEYLLPLGPPTSFSPPIYEKSQRSRDRWATTPISHQPDARRRNYSATT